MGRGGWLAAGTVKRIIRFPVKAMGGQELLDTVLPAAGVPHDRRYAVMGEDGRPIPSSADRRLLLARARMADGGLRFSCPMAVSMARALSLTGLFRAGSGTPPCCVA